MTDCIRCGVDLTERDAERGAVAHVACPGADPMYAEVVAVIVAEIAVRTGHTFARAIPEALNRVEHYAAYWSIDVEKLRAAIVGEARSRGVVLPAAKVDAA